MCRRSRYISRRSSGRRHGGTSPSEDATGALCLISVTVLEELFGGDCPPIISIITIITVAGTVGGYCDGPEALREELFAFARPERAQDALLGVLELVLAPFGVNFRGSHGVGRAFREEIGGQGVSWRSDVRLLELVIVGGLLVILMLMMILILLVRLLILMLRVGDLFLLGVVGLLLGVVVRVLLGGGILGRMWTVAGGERRGQFVLEIWAARRRVGGLRVGGIVCVIHMGGCERRLA